MDDKNLINEPAVIKAVSWIIAQAPAFAGAVVSLAFIGELTGKGRVMAVGVGALTAAFIGPAVIDVIHLLWGAMPASIGGAVTFLLAASAMGGLPRLLKVLVPFWGDPMGLLKQFTPQKPTPPAPPANEGGAS